MRAYATPHSAIPDYYFGDYYFLNKFISFYWLSWLRFVNCIIKEMMMIMMMMMMSMKDKMIQH